MAKNNIEEVIEEVPPFRYKLLLFNKVPSGYTLAEDGPLTEEEAIYCVTCGKVGATKGEYEAKLVEVNPSSIT